MPTSTNPAPGRPARHHTPVRRVGRTLRDLAWLGKPGITVFCVLVAAGTAALAMGQGHGNPGTLLPLVLGTALAVMAAGGLNMVLERETDARMERTRTRPVASGRLSPALAATWATLQGAGGVALLAVRVNLLTAGLALSALVLYVAVYTPLKPRTRVAALLGTLPGAIPALMGWAAMSGRLAAPALVVFGMLVLWQLPHTLAISLRRRADFAAAGLPTVPSVLGEEPARFHAFLWTSLLFSFSLLLVPMGVAGSLYFLVASLVGGWLVYLGVVGLEPAVESQWARRFFVASLVYVPVITAGLLLDRLLG